MLFKNHVVAAVDRRTTGKLAVPLIVNVEIVNEEFAAKYAVEPEPNPFVLIVSDAAVKLEVKVIPLALVFDEMMLLNGCPLLRTN